MVDLRRRAPSPFSTTFYYYHEDRTTLRPSQAEKEEAFYIRGRIKGQRQPIQKLAQFLGEIMHQPVLDETGLKDKYGWDLPYNRAGSDALVTALREQLGLELRKTKRTMEILIVEKGGPTKRNQ